MGVVKKGKLILDGLPGRDLEARLIDLLSEFLKQRSRKILAERIKNLPLVLGKDISLEIGEKVALALRRLGASATFVLDSEGREEETEGESGGGRPVTQAMDSPPADAMGEPLKPAPGRLRGRQEGRSRDDNWGSLIIEAVSDSDSEARLVELISRFLRRGSREALAERIRNPPFVIGEDVSRKTGEKIARVLRKLGASVTFAPHSQNREETMEGEFRENRPVARTADPPPPHAPGEPANPGPKGQKRRLVRTVLVFLIVVASLSLLGWQIYQFMKAKAREETIILGSPAVLRVSPRDMYWTYLDQYKIRPDRRIVKAFEILAGIYGRFQGGADGNRRYTVGKVESTEKEVIVPLTAEGRPKVEIRIPLPMNFRQSMQALSECLLAMTGGPAPPANRHPGGTGDSYSMGAVLQGNLIDPQGLVLDLADMDRLWREQPMNPTIYRAAARAYTMLLMILYPDRMEYSDEFASCALAFLTLARYLEPSAPVASDEAFLAANMGYAADALQLLDMSGPPGEDPVAQAFDAYVRRDIRTLRTLKLQSPNIVESYLLHRLYRGMLLFSDCQDEAEELLQRFPNSLPVSAAILKSGDIGSAKALMARYPKAVLALLHDKFVRSARPETGALNRRPGTSGPVDADTDISPSEFDSLLEKWRPVDELKDGGFIITEERIRTVFRSLYADALRLRFEVLFRRWGMVERAKAYAESLQRVDGKHPLVMEMTAAVLSKLKEKEQSDRLFEEVVAHPKASGTQVEDAYNKNGCCKVRLAPAAAARLDGRPDHLDLMGNVLQAVLNYDLAEKFYTLAIERNPYLDSTYENLSRITKNDELLENAVEKSPLNPDLLEAAGERFSRKSSRADREKALKFYDMALRIAPRDSLFEGKAKVLCALDRCGEAVEIYRQRIQESDGGGLGAIVLRAHLAELHLRMGKPELALEALGDSAESYQGNAMLAAARTYERLGRLDEAEKWFVKGVERYPTVMPMRSNAAGFLWRRGRYEDASKMIAQGRTVSSTWYSRQFLESLENAQEKDITDAVACLCKLGAGDWEIRGLALEFWTIKRYEIALKILLKVPPSTGAGVLDILVLQYAIIREWQGEETALKYLHAGVPNRLRDELPKMLFHRGFVEAALTELQNPAEYPPEKKDFLWLLRLAAWLAMENKPDALGMEFAEHYRAAGPAEADNPSASSDSAFYHQIGRCLLGLISFDELLTHVQTTGQRCEFAYFAGFSERLKLHFSETATWYGICRETLLPARTVIGWARGELDAWTRVGTGNRHRLLGDDLLEAIERARSLGEPVPWGT